MSEPTRDPAGELIGKATGEPATTGLLPPTGLLPSTGLLPPTPGQTVGPFFGYALPYERGNELVEPGTPGAVRLHGTVYDGAGSPVPDALIEIWQADPAGAVVRRSGSILRDGTFTGWGRAETDREGGYWFRTLNPGATEPGRAAFFAVTVFARGLQDRLFTRAYLPDGAGAPNADVLDADLRDGGPLHSDPLNADPLDADPLDTDPLDADPLLASLEPERRATLVTSREPDGSLRFDIRLQGEGETVFLTYDGAPGAGRDGVGA